MSAVPESEAAAQTAAKKAQPKDRLLNQIKSLDASDDVRTSISKKISWILRHGASKANVKQNKDRWVKFSDLCQAELLKEHGEDLIWQVIIDFNGKKLRYQIEEDENGRRIRAYKREDLQKMESRKVASGGAGAGLSKDAQEFTPTPATGATPSTPAAGSALPPSPQAHSQAQAQAQAAAMQMGMYPQVGFPWFGYGMMPYMNPMMWQAAAAAQPNKYTGRIKSFSNEKGYGFIECAQTYQLFQRDVFLHKAQMGDLEVGAMVMFSCEENKKRMPQAKDVQAIQAGMQPPAPPTPSAGGKGAKGGGKDGAKGKGGGKGKGKEGGKKKGKGEGKGNKEKGDKEEKEAAPAAEKEGEATAAS